VVNKGPEVSVCKAGWKLRNLCMYSTPSRSVQAHIVLRGGGDSFRSRHMLITATDNPLIRHLASLHDAAGRRASASFLVEGRRAIAGFLAAGWSPIQLLVRSGCAVPEGWPAHLEIGERALAKASAASTPSGYLAEFALPAEVPLDRAAGGLVLAGVSDPGNLGTLLRTAAAFSVAQVVCIGGADPYAPKVVQASAGALAAVRLHRLAGCIELAGGAALCALVPRGGSGPDALVPGRRWLVVGGEANGVAAADLACCSEQLTLPMPGEAVESLNAAVAGAIGLWEVFVRRAGAPGA
jgi:TrmH family RNA methyltransferase